MPSLADVVEQLSEEPDLTEVMQVLVERCGALFGADAVGLLLAGAAGQLQVAAATGGADRLLLLQSQRDDGPAFDAWRDALPVSSADLATEPRWASWTTAATAGGFGAVDALPMAARGSCFGGLVLLSRSTGVLAGDALAAARVLCRVASLLIVWERGRRADVPLVQQLEEALASRVVLEQAKGVVSERNAVAMDAAFERIRQHARTTGRTVTEVAGDVVADRLRLT